MMQTSTCIVGLEHEGSVYIGGDSAGVNEALDIRVRADEKVFKKHNMIFGFTSSFRMGQIIRYSFNPPMQAVGEGDYEYLCGPWTDALIECFRSKGYATVDNNLVTGGTFLVGFNGSLYNVQDDFQVGRHIFPYDTCGCGGRLAIGAISALYDIVTDPEELIMAGLKAAEKFSAGVSGPFVIECLNEDNTEFTFTEE